MATFALATSLVACFVASVNALGSTPNKEPRSLPNPLPKSNALDDGSYGAPATAKPLSNNKPEILSSCLLTIARICFLSVTGDDPALVAISLPTVAAILSL